MDAEVLRKLEQETIRELDYVSEFEEFASPEYHQVMDQIRENCKILNQEAAGSIDEYRAVEDTKLQRQKTEEEAEFRKQKELVDLHERRKDRWINFGLTTAGIVIPAGLYYVLCKLGFTFEETNTVSSTFFKNVLSRIKPK